MQGSLVSLSNDLAKIVEEVQPNVVAVHARSHYPSSGVVWRPGIVVTADHTLRRDEDIQVTLANGNRVNATLVGRDGGTDIAALKVENAGPSAPITDGSDPIKAGELALVIGRSPDSGANATMGIVSAVSGKWRTWRGGELDHYIRLDASLFPSSSGGAVVNSRGRVIGIATSALSRIAGLAIPASSINRVLDALVSKGHVPRGYLGIGAQPVGIPESLRTGLSLKNESGIMVISVERGGPADQAGVLMGDILVRLEHSRLDDIADLQTACGSSAIGAPAKAQVIRAGQLREIEITIGERPGK